MALDSDEYLWKNESSVVLFLSEVTKQLREKPKPLLDWIEQPRIRYLPHLKKVQIELSPQYLFTLYCIGPLGWTKLT